MATASCNIASISTTIGAGRRSVTGFSAGSGTSSDPYIITNVYELDYVRNDLSAYYELGNDIDASMTENWDFGRGFEPIGTDNSFTGNFEGNGYIINQLYSFPSESTDDYCYVGLFGSIDTSNEIKNIGLKNVNFSSINNNNGTRIYAGGFSGHIDSGSIHNCFVTGQLEGTTATDYSFHGGFIGYNYNASINNCYSDTNIIDNGFSTGDEVGGFIGRNYVDISNCYSTSSTNFGKAFCGYNNSGTITDCYYDSNICSQSDSYATGYTTSEMKDTANFPNWGFSNTWGNDSDINDGYHYLQVFHETASSGTTASASVATINITTIQASINNVTSTANGTSISCSLTSLTTRSSIQSRAPPTSVNTVEVFATSDTQTTAEVSVIGVTETGLEGSSNNSTTSNGSVENVALDTKTAVGNVGMQGGTTNINGNTIQANISTSTTAGANSTTKISWNEKQGNANSITTSQANITSINSIEVFAVTDTQTTAEVTIVGASQFSLESSVNTEATSSGSVEKVTFNVRLSNNNTQTTANVTRTNATSTSLTATNINTQTSVTSQTNITNITINPKEGTITSRVTDKTRKATINLSIKQTTGSKITHITQTTSINFTSTQVITQTETTGVGEHVLITFNNEEAVKHGLDNLEPNIIASINNKRNVTGKVNSKRKIECSIDC